MTLHATTEEIKDNLGLGETDQLIITDYITNAIEPTKPAVQVITLPPVADAVDDFDWEESMAGSLYPSDTTLVSEMRDALEDGDKLQFIKCLRELASIDLKSAKDASDIIFTTYIPGSGRWI